MISFIDIDDYNCKVEVVNKVLKVVVIGILFFFGYICGLGRLMICLMMIGFVDFEWYIFFVVDVVNCWIIFFD